MATQRPPPNAAARYTSPSLPRAGFSQDLPSAETIRSPSCPTATNTDLAMRRVSLCEAIREGAAVAAALTVRGWCPAALEVCRHGGGVSLSGQPRQPAVEGGVLRRGAVAERLHLHPHAVEHLDVEVGDRRLLREVELPAGP